MTSFLTNYLFNMQAVVNRGECTAIGLRSDLYIGCSFTQTDRLTSRLSSVAAKAMS